MMAQPIIKIKGLYKDYQTIAGSFPVLKNVNLTINEGEYYETLKDDPRRSKKADEKVSLASAPYHIEALQKTKTSLPDEETRTLPMNKGATKFVNKFVEKAKKLHEEHEKQNAEAA